MSNNQIKKTIHIRKSHSELIFFEDLFNDYYALLVSYAYKFVNDKQVAEDIVQDVFMALWIKKDDIDFSEPIKPYLYKATHNKSLNYLGSLQLTQPLETCDVDTQIHHEIIQYNQSDSLLLKEMSEEIESFIETLPPQCKRVFKLSRSENKKNREIAVLLGISEKAVEKQISKALSELRLHLKKTGFISVLYWIYIG